MGAAGSIPLSKEAALAAGHSEEEVDAYLKKQEAAKNEGVAVAPEAATEAPAATTEPAPDATPVVDSASGETAAAPADATKDTPTATPDATATSDATVHFKIEISSTDMAASKRPATSKRAPARFRNRPPTSRRPPREATAVAKKAAKTAAAKTEGPETDDSKPAKPPAAKVEKTVEEVVAYKAIEGIFETTRRDSNSEADADVTREALLQTLEKHDEDTELCTKLGLPAPKEGEPKSAVSAFRSAYDEYVTAFTDTKKDGVAKVDEVANFLTKHKHSVLRLMGMAAAV